MTETTHEALLRQTAATEEMLDYFQGQRAGFQDNVAEAEGDYAQFAANLKGVVAGELGRNIHWTPAAAADDPANNIFKTWSAVVDYVQDSPASAVISVRLVGVGEDFLVDRNLSLTTGKSLRISANHGDLIKLTIVSYVENGENSFYEIKLAVGSVIDFNGFEIYFGPLVIAGGAIATAAAFLSHNGSSTIAFSSVDASCATKGRILFINQWSGTCQVNAESCDFDGDIVVVDGRPDAIVLYSVRGGGLTNGATLYNTDSYTIGQNMLFG